ncbi:hypothetical protein [Planotetraspora sp. GP83]|uniref:hypothetical protein n=1 Tax=Planotetraspora sp. GP83 TaxID=3156264 RepID=UPI003518AE74
MASKTRARTAGTRLTELRRSSAAGRHDPRPRRTRTRAAARQAATAFTRALREQLEEFRAQHPLFTSLVVPVKVTFLVVPPEQGKDLDNIARVALPVVHDVLRPHIEPYLLAPQPPDEEPKPWREEALRRLRSLNANSVAAYQVIELPRAPHDPREGVLRFALGSTHSYRSWWDQAAAYVDERINDADHLFG